MGRPINFGVFECGHTGRYWKIPLAPWKQPHWFCRHCNRRIN